MSIERGPPSLILHHPKNSTNSPPPFLFDSLTLACWHLPKAVDEMLRLDVTVWKPFRKQHQRREGGNSHRLF